MPTFALLIWPIVILCLFGSLPLRHALISTFLASFLLLPEGFALNFTGLPPINKTSVTIVAVLLSLLIFGKKEQIGWRGETRESQRLINQNPAIGKLVIGLAALLFVTPIFTILNNGAAISIGGRVLPALRPWDYISMASATIFLITPYFLGRRYFATPAEHRLLLHALLIAGLAYSVLILIELRFSPQLHKWVYGFHQHSFAQHFRGGAYRPKVFLQHGLWVGFFMFTTAFAGFCLAKGKEIDRKRFYLFSGIWCLSILLLSKNLAASLLGLIFIPALLFGNKIKVQILYIVSILIIIFPLMRQVDLVPINTILNISSSISEERAESLRFRIDNENRLLTRAAEKPISGWGEWGRSRIFDSQGNDISTTDGAWIVVLGTQGWLGYVSFFGLLIIPILSLRKTIRRKKIPIEAFGLAMITAANLIYLIPNSALSPIGWLIAGALAGFVQFDLAKKEIPDEISPDTESKRIVYTRFSNRK